MATFTLLEWSGMDHHGNPIEPPFNRAVAVAFDAPKQLNDATVYFKVIPDIDARFRISRDGAAATAADRKIYADIGTGGVTAIVDLAGMPVYVNLTTA